MQEHWFKTQRRASSVLKWAMDMSLNGFPTEEDNPLYLEGCRGALFDLRRKPMNWPTGRIGSRTGAITVPT